MAHHLTMYYKSMIWTSRKFKPKMKLSKLKLKVQKKKPTKLYQYYAKKKKFYRKNSMMIEVAGL